MNPLVSLVPSVPWEHGARVEDGPSSSRSPPSGAPASLSSLCRPELVRTHDQRAQWGHGLPRDPKAQGGGPSRKHDPGVTAEGEDGQDTAGWPSLPPHQSLLALLRSLVAPELTLQEPRAAAALPALPVAHRRHGRASGHTGSFSAEPVTKPSCLPPRPWPPRPPGQKGWDDLCFLSHASTVTLPFAEVVAESHAFPCIPPRSHKSVSRRTGASQDGASS